MAGRTRTTLVAALASATVILFGSPGAEAAAGVAAHQPPQTVVGPLIPGGADGSPHLVRCPPMQSVYSGGFTITADPGRELSESPADLLESRPNENATGWVIAVRKGQTRGRDGRHGARPANLRITIVCSDAMPENHGGA
ncbi:hypothetical protein [Streptomyces sp. ISL-94]|uniref:hypothetical protein n=1 Tax=Streptomyces sp. ISL-94 TaxID=2819190 RepID=UPI001BE8B34C|nr:hypothetical protein [Streptomyces sp. ISL-94]MBT2477527.1 hypothetical protein [Streptomyces sp. ISL-94]